ncbi:Gfo/Idh/MocA family oxidoreductase [Flammeovirga sp. MY04]|uniref:Gfo/Idh/MocA family protein n=1 Tax=Flammeovirga sp. MY04 TaxID=1191459 RepID=UPI00080639A0|nr:Gfo/Idh/MocA family oxidoreductase [Flammeovirga sp. MY04]ANQ49731.1 Gfo/Idh/MocA family oxidoreductase [Flammeovirga sp. MY04]
MEINYQYTLPKIARPIIIIGAGGIVNDAHMPAYRKAGFEVYGITNRTKERAEKIAAKFDIPRVFDSIDDAIAQAPENAVFDLTLMPNQFVATLEKLPDAAAVLIQKPLGDYFEQTKEIIEVCRRKKLIAAVNCQLRFAPYIMAARDLIKKEAIGKIYDMEVKVSVYTPWEIFPNVMYHQRLEIQQHSIHHIDLVRSFLGDPKGIMAKTLKHPAKEMSSTRTNIIMEYDDDVRALVSTNHDHVFGFDHQESYVKWEGTKGAIYAKMGLLMNYPDGMPDSFEYCILEEGKKPEWKTKQLEGSWFPDAFIGTMSSLICYANGESDHLDTSIEDILKTMHVVEAAYKSSDMGGVKPEYGSI